MTVRTESEIKAYIEGWNACYKQFRECLKDRKSLIDAIQKMETYNAAVNRVMERSEDER